MIKLLKTESVEGLYAALITAQFVDPSSQTPSSPRYRSTLTLSRPLGLSGSCMSAYSRDVDRHLSSKTGLYREGRSLYRLIRRVASYHPTVIFCNIFCNNIPLFLSFFFFFFLYFVFLEFCFPNFYHDDVEKGKN